MRMFPTRRGKRLRSPTIKKTGFLLGSLAALFLAFLAAFYLFFPAAPLKERLEHEIARSSTLSLDIEELSLEVPPGLRIRRATLATGLAVYPEIPVADAIFRPQWTTLFSSSPGVRFTLHSQKATLTGKVRKGGAAEVEIVDFPFSVPLQPGSSLAVSGSLDRGRFSGSLPIRKESETTLELDLQDVTVAGLQALGLPDGKLDLGRLSLRGKGQGRSLRLDRLEAEGGHLEVSGSGTVLVGGSPRSSRLNLTLTLRPAAAAPPQTGELLGLFADKRRDGSYRLRLSGSLAAPRVR